MSGFNWTFELEPWQRFAGKWATGTTGQKPYTLVDIATIDFKGFFDPLQRMAEKYSFWSASRLPGSYLLKFHVKNGCYTKMAHFLGNRCHTSK
jgi:hypothetical protein